MSEDDKPAANPDAPKDGSGDGEAPPKPSKLGDGDEPDGSDPSTANGGDGLGDAVDAVSGGEASVGEASDESEAPPKRSRRKRADEAKPSAAEPGSDKGERMDLPKWNRAKVKRKVAGEGQEDQVQGGIRRAGNFTLQQAPVVIGGIMLVAAVIVGVQYLLSRQAESRAEATRLLAEAAAAESRGVVGDFSAQLEGRTRPVPIPLFKTEEAQRDAIDKPLSSLDEQADGSAADVVAELMRAADLMAAMKFDDAESTYKAFAAAHPEHELVFVAREGVVLALEAQDNVDQALTEVEALIGREGDLYRDQGLWHKARMLEGQGKVEDAKAVYETYAKEYPLESPSMAREQVIERLQELAPDLVPKPKTDPLAGLGMP